MFACSFQKLVVPEHDLQRMHHSSTFCCGGILRRRKVQSPIQQAHMCLPAKGQARTEALSLNNNKNINSDKKITALVITLMNNNKNNLTYYKKRSSKGPCEHPTSSSEMDAARRDCAPMQHQLHGLTTAD